MLNVIDCLGNDKVCFLLCLSQFQSVTYFAGLKELYIYLDIHVVGGKDWSFKIVVEKNNAKDKWQLIKGCGSFFERWIRMAEWHVFVYCRLIYQYNGLWTTGSGCAVPWSRTSKMSADRTAASTCQFDWPSE